MESNTVRRAVDRMCVALASELRVGEESKTVREAVDRMSAALVSEIRGALGTGVYDYPQIANGPIEQVLAFNNDETIALKGSGPNLHFSSHGTLTDLRHGLIPGSEVRTTFPVDPAAFPGTIEFPPPQVEPFDAPPLDNTNVTGIGFSKQAYFFNGGADYFVTVGPSIPKIAKAKNGGAQFWVGSIGVISQGVGRFEGVRGVTVYIGSAYLPVWPDAFDKQIKILQTGFRALIGTYVKFIPKADRA